MIIAVLGQAGALGPLATDLEADHRPIAVTGGTARRRRPSSNLSPSTASGLFPRRARPTHSPKRVRLATIWWVHAADRVNVPRWRAGPGALRCTGSASGRPWDHHVQRLVDPRAMVDVRTSSSADDGRRARSSQRRDHGGRSGRPSASSIVHDRGACSPPRGGAGARCLGRFGQLQTSPQRQGRRCRPPVITGGQVGPPDVGQAQVVDVGIGRPTPPGRRPAPPSSPTACCAPNCPAGCHAAAGLTTTRWRRGSAGCRRGSDGSRRGWSDRSIRSAVVRALGSST
jgi:hypothetical protein